jgi:hypothetical protein
MECNALYKNWVHYLKVIGYYRDYMYVIGRTVDSNFYRQYSPKSRYPAKRIVFIPNLNQSRYLWGTFPSPTTVTRATLLIWMSRVDTRVKSLNSLYTYHQDGKKMLDKDIIWHDVALDFVKQNIENFHGKDVAKRIFKRWEARKEARRRKELERYRVSLYTDCNSTTIYTTTGRVYRANPERNEARVVRYRNRDIGGQWYDQFNRVNRENRWRIRR